jgi:hypothetical protein
MQIIKRIRIKLTISPLKLSGKDQKRERDVIFESQHNKNEIFFGTKTSKNN